MRGCLAAIRRIARSSARVKLSCRLVTNAPPPPTLGMPPPTGDARDTDAFVQLLHVGKVLRRRWPIVALTTGLSLAGAAVALQLLAPKWRASATIVLHAAGPQVFDKVKGVTEDSESRATSYQQYYQTQRAIMSSRAVAEDALQQLGLASDPAFLGVADIRDPEEQAAAAQAIDPVERLRETVRIEEIRNSRVVEISAVYPDAAVAADIANAVADAYVAFVQRGRSRLGSEAKDNIASEREKALARLRDAEQALETFKTDHAITSISLSDRQNVITQDILTLSARAKEAEAERIRLERMLGQAKALHEQGNLSASTLLLGERRDVFEQLRKEKLGAEAEFHAVDVEYGPKHEEHRKAKAKLDLVGQALDREGQELLDSLRARTEVARQIERDLQAALKRENDKALELGRLERTYRELEREAHVAADEYLLVARRDTEIAITNRVEDEGIEILDRATVPVDPVSPQRGLLLALALVGGLGLGSLLALSADLRDQRIRGLVDLERTLAPFGVPVLGQLPLLPPDSRLGIGNARAQRRQRDLYAHRFPQSLMAERCRGVRTSIAFVRGSSPAKTLMVTSPSSSEGKSATAINLALSFCQSGKRVLLIDADMRRPRLHQVFETPLPHEARGLATVLAGKATLDDAIAHLPDEAPENLWLLPCGSVPEHPAELLENGSVRRLLAELGARFEVIVIDTPPVLPVSDPLILAPQVDGVVIVSRCEQTTRGELQRTMSALLQADANVLGVVLNEVDARQERDGYGGYYTYAPRETGSAPG